MSPMQVKGHEFIGCVSGDDMEGDGWASGHDGRDGNRVEAHRDFGKRTTYATTEHQISGI